LVYDTEHWQQRMVTNLGPGLRAAGYADPDIAGFSADVTAAVAEQLAGAVELDAAAWEPDGYMAALGQVLDRKPGTMVDHGTVEQALLQLAGGQGDAAAALSMLGGGGA
jgi:hypothetical protein